MWKLYRKCAAVRPTKQISTIQVPRTRPRRMTNPLAFLLDWANIPGELAESGVSGWLLAIGVMMVAVEFAQWLVHFVA